VATAEVGAVALEQRDLSIEEDEGIVLSFAPQAQQSLTEGSKT